MARKKSTIVRISDEHRDWIDQRRETFGLSRDAYMRALLAEVIETDRALADAAQIRSRAAVASWKQPSTPGQRLAAVRSQ